MSGRVASVHGQYEGGEGGDGDGDGAHDNGLLNAVATQVRRCSCQYHERVQVLIDLPYKWRSMYRGGCSTGTCSRTPVTLCHGAELFPPATGAGEELDAWECVVAHCQHCSYCRLARLSEEI